MSCHHNGEQNDNIKIANKSWKNAAKFKYLEITVTNQRFNLNRTNEYTESGECNVYKTKELQKPSTFTEKNEY
jgi:hypothetical protein